jgi:hypothetical protein
MSRHYRPGIQNGTVAKRRPRLKPIVLPARSSAPPMAEGPPQTRPLLYLIICGLCIAAGFVLSLHQHFTANAFGCDDVRVKADLDRAFSEQHELELRRARALSPVAIERAAHQQGGLAPLKFDPLTALRTPAMIEKSGRLSRAEALPASEKIAIESHEDRSGERQVSGRR